MLFQKAVFQRKIRNIGVRKPAVSGGSGKKYAAVFAIAILVAVVAGGRYVKQRESERFLSVERTGKLLCFTELSGNKLLKFLGKEKGERLTYADMYAILERLEMDKTIHSEKLEKKSDSPIDKKEFLAVYDRLTALLDAEQKIHNEKLVVLGYSGNVKGLKDGQVYTTAGIYDCEDKSALHMAFQGLEVVTSKGEILLVRGETNEAMTLSNVWITKSTKKGFEVFVDGCYVEVDGRPKGDKLQSVVADVTFAGGKAVKISKKEEKVNGKVLAVKKEGVELEGYGLIPYAPGYRIYQVYGELKELKPADLSAGHTQTEFVVAGGQICAGLVVKRASAENIRVLLKSDGYKSLYHAQAVVTSSGEFTVSYGKKKEKHKAKEKVVIKKDSNYFKSGRIKITPKSLTGKIKVLSLNRGCGHPAYRGSIELVSSKEGIVMINDVGIEEYLYAVVPSEMPTSYPMEALKAQAICARSFAYRQIESSTYPEYGAHVDDSTSFQVYHNSDEDKNSIKAVDDTNQQIGWYKDKIMGAYYYSTSCGHTTSDRVWKTGNEAGTPYFKAKFVAKKQGKENLTKEKEFRKFIKNKNYKSYDTSEAWFRWSISYSKKELETLINSRLSGLFVSKPEHVLVKDGKGKFKRGKIASVGVLKSLAVVKRREGGAAQELQITGSKATVKVVTENSIRSLLAVSGKTIRQKGGGTAKMGTLLPSSFFTVDSSKGKFVLTGGGFGHGIGMSQNGAKHMAEDGMNCEEILKFFYTGIEIR